ncbi:MAG: 3-hydroxyacyl-CoA dehydrogenase NAD-binding domain-containing protein [Bacillota bacterium]|nr:3-hydroxyacyl-CoA dehydrogenase NAD-binding domain-containing protein [Bacillota bacterium]
MKKIAVLGAGLMGASIALVAAQAGYSVILRDIQMSPVKDGMKTIELELNKQINKGMLDEKTKAEIFERIHGTIDLAEVAEADLVIEAVVENMAVKKQIFAELDVICPEHTILATNTSSLSITEIASATNRKDRVMGMHFLNPIPNLQLVELVKGIETSDQTVELAQQCIKQMGKEYVVVNRDSPGFIVNRILVLYINEAITVLGEGTASAESIDTAMKLGAGMLQGPLELADSYGLDALYAVLLVFYNEYKDTKYRPHTLFSTLVRAGYYGKKSGKGFYTYY